MPPKPRKARNSGGVGGQSASVAAPERPPRLGMAELQQMADRAAAAAERTTTRVDNLEAVISRRPPNRVGVPNAHLQSMSEALPVAASAEEGIPPTQPDPAADAELGSTVQELEPVPPSKYTCLRYTGPGVPVSDNLLLPAVVELIRAGTIVADSVVWSEGFDPSMGHNGWVPLTSAVDLFEWPEGVDVLDELAAAATRRLNDEAAAKNSEDTDVVTEQASAVPATTQPGSAVPAPGPLPQESEPERAELEPEPEPDMTPEPDTKPSSVAVLASRPDLPHVPGLPRRVRLLDTHVVATLGWRANAVYYVLQCDQVSGETTDEVWTTIKRFSDVQDMKTKLGIGDQLAAPFPSEKGLEAQKHATPQAAAEWLLGCVAAGPHDAGAQTSTGGTHLALVPWAADATACWKWDATVSMWSSAKPLDEIAAQLKARSESKPVLLSVFGNVRTVGSDTAVPMLETHLPIWCTTTLQLAQGAVQNGLKQFFSVCTPWCRFAILSTRYC